MKSFSKILVANRGEIALRIIHTCRQLGISTVAVYSDADVTAPHAKAADEAIYLGAALASESYLDSAKIIAAALRTNCDALHPGYGFLSENADFAAACAAARIIFIGPETDVIRPLGLKNAARKIAADAGLQIVPGYDGSDQSNENLRAEILRLGFPVLIKAAAGGGGKGMRVVQAADENPDADILVWIDYGIFRLPGVTNQAIYEFTEKLNDKAIYAPGCWDKPAVIETTFPNWRFCGSVLAVPRKMVDQLDFACRVVARQHIVKTNNVDWEVNTWARVEASRKHLPLHWYKADHNGSMFTDLEIL